MLIISEVVFFYVKISNNTRQAILLENKITASDTKQNKLISENSLITKADAMYNSDLIQKNLKIDTYISDLKNVIQSTTNYYGIFHPIKATVSYNNVPIGVTSLVPVKISIQMLNIFDYTPIRVVFTLFNNTRGTMNCNGLSISREYSENIFKQVANKRYLFSSNINLEWLVLLNPSETNYYKTFFINYHFVKDLEKIEHMYNMATWNESFMLLPEDIDKLQDIQRSMR